MIDAAPGELDESKKGAGSGEDGVFGVARGATGVWGAVPSSRAGKDGGVTLRFLDEAVMSGSGCWSSAVDLRFRFVVEEEATPSAPGEDDDS